MRRREVRAPLLSSSLVVLGSSVRRITESSSQNPNRRPVLIHLAGAFSTLTEGRSLKFGEQLWALC